MPNRRKSIEEEKAKRIAVGATVAGVLLIIFLVVILIVQLVQMGVAREKDDRLVRQIEEYSEMTERKQNDLEWYQYGDGLYYLARQMGMK